MILKGSLQTVTHRAMQPLASLKGDAEVRTFVDTKGDLTLTSYPYEADHYRRVALQLAAAVEAAS